MNHGNYFKDLLESTPDFRKKILLLLLLRKIKNLLPETGFFESVINRLNLELILTEQFEDYLHFIKNERESFIERFLNRKMENYFAMTFADIRHGRSLILLLSLV